MSNSTKPSTNRSLRLTLVTETYPPEVNGVARTLERWVQAFEERGHTVHVIRPRQVGEPPAANLVRGQPLPFYPQVRVGIATPLRLLGLFRRQQPDLLHIATEGPLGLSALLAACWLRIPVASSFHTNFDHYASHYGLFGLGKLGFQYLRWFHNCTEVTLVPSLATRARLLISGVQRVEIWSRGVDSELFHPRHRDPELRRSVGLGPDDLLLLYVGRLAPEKNLPVLLQAFANLRQSLPAPLTDRVRLALVGAGPLSESLASAVPPGVVLAGLHQGLSLSRWYASADLFVFPSQSETFGNVVLEAQASGLAVVGFDCQGVNEQVIPEENGLLVPPESDLVPAIRRLCLDTAFRRRCALAARRRAENLGWKPIFDSLEQRYYHVLESHAARSAVPSRSLRPVTRIA